MTKRTPKTTKPEPTSVETYAARRNDIARLIDVLQMELDAHAKRANAAPRDWGLVGDLDLARSDLINTTAFISGMERQEIEAFLNDAI